MVGESNVMTLASALVPEEPTAESAKPDRRILWLVVGHVAIGLLAAFLAGPDVPDGAVLTIVVVGIIFSQVTLTGIWVGLGLNSMGQRVVGFVGCFTYFLLFLWLTEGIHRQSILTVVVLLAVATVPLLSARLCGFSILPTVSSGALSGRPQFSIFQLLAITSIVAMMLTLVMQMRTHYPDGFLIFGVQFIFTTVGMLQVYVFLATNRPFVALGVTALAPFALYLIVQLLPVPTDAIAAIGISITPIVIAISLLIVRSCGYRLVTRPWPHRRTTAMIGVESSSSQVAE